MKFLIFFFVQQSVHSNDYIRNFSFVLLEISTKRSAQDKSPSKKYHHSNETSEDEKKSIDQIPLICPNETSHSRRGLKQIRFVFQHIFESYFLSLSLMRGGGQIFDCCHRAEFGTTRQVTLEIGSRDSNFDCAG